MTARRGEFELADGTAAFVAGEGPPVVFLHGVGLDRHVWDKQVEAFAATRMVVTYDLMGHGQSPSAQDGAGLSLWVEQLHDLAVEMELVRFALVGFSFGGLIAQAYALAHPERLDRLVLMNTVYDRSPAEQASIAARLAQARAEGPQSIIAAALERWFSPGFALVNPEVIAAYKARLEANKPGSFLAAYACFAGGGGELAGRLGGIRCPTHVMTGELDSGSTPAMAVNMAAAIPGARHSILPGARHMMPVERAGEVNAGLLRFLNGDRA